MNDKKESTQKREQPQEDLNQGELFGEMYVLYVDIMGFKDRVIFDTHQKLKEDLYKLKKDIDGELSPFVKKTKTLRVALFSDSILVVDCADREGFNRISKAAVGVMKVALENKFPVKGAIAKGEFTYDPEKQIFFGKPLVNAFLLHESINFYGIVAHHSMEEDIEKFVKSKSNPNPWSKTAIALKKSKTTHYHIAYNLSDLKRKVGVDCTDTYLKWLEKIEKTVSGEPRSYIDRTREILKADSELYEKSKVFPIKLR